MKKRLLVSATLSLLGASSLISCGGGIQEAEPNVIQIYAWESGLGMRWMKQIVEDFNASQSDYVATLETTTNSATIAKTLDLGTSNPYDLYFTSLGTFQHYSNFEVLDDVLAYRHEGESKTIEEKFYPGFLDAERDPNDGKYRLLNYGNTVGGIVYNADMIDENEVPRTTDELSDLVLELKNEKITPWLFYSELGGLNGYWNYVSSAWAAQYDGLDYYHNHLMALKDDAGNSPSRAVFEKKDGRYKALKVMEDIITPDTTHQQCTNTSFTTVQNLYLQGAAALTINGSWLLNENKSTANINMMKTPVISSIVEKLDDKDMDDATLSEIIALIDKETPYDGTTYPCSENDYKRIEEARHIIYNNSAEQYIFVPTYSNAKEASKSFLKYFFKDSSILTYMNDLHLPSNVRLDNPSLYDGNSDSTWAKTLFAMAEKEGLMARASRSSVLRDHGVNAFAGVQTAQSFLASNKNDRKNADQVWEEFLAVVDEGWEAWTNE